MTLEEYLVFNNWWKNINRRGFYSFAYPRINDKTGTLEEYIENKLDGMLIYNDDPGFGNPDLADSNPQLELRHTGEVNIYPQRVVEERLNIELMNVPRADGNGSDQNKPIRFSAQNPEKVQVEITFNNGLISYNDNGEKQNAEVKIQVQWRDYPRNDPEEGWKTFGRFGAEPYNSSSGVTTITRQKAKVMRFIAECNFSWNEINLATGRTIEIRVIRTSVKDVDNTRIADTVFLTGIRTWCFDNETAVGSNGRKSPQRPMIEKYRDQTARLGFRIKATDSLQGTIDALNCIVESYARTWNGTEWSSTESASNNPASVALKVLQSPALGRGAYPDSMLDLDSFGEFYQWCSDRKYTCNGVLTSERRVDDLLQAILTTGRGMRILNGNRYSILIDKPRENPVYILNNQNVLEASNTKNFDDPPDAFSIKFVNELDGYQETEVYVTADGTARPGPDARIESLEMPFVTDHEQIIKNGRYLLACRHLRPEVWHRKLSMDGYLIGIGDRVEVQDDTIVVGIGEGAVITGLKIESDYITEIQTDGEFDIADMTKIYGIKIMQFDGYTPAKVRTIQVPIPEPGIYSNFKVEIPLNSNPPIPGKGDIVSFGVYDRISTSAICFGKKADGEGHFDVTLIPYQEGIYTTDSGPIPPYEANITSPGGLAPLNQIPPTPVTIPDVVDVVSHMEITGRDAVRYELRPSVNIIVRETSGRLVPDIISCSQVMTAGNNPPVPSDKTLEYITSNSDTPVKYTFAIPVGNWEWIEFILSDSDIELDRERVPVLREGDSSLVIDLNDQLRPISCYHDGTPKEDQIPFTVQATLFLGSSIVSPEWSLINAPRGITIDQAGLITVADDYKYINDIPYYPTTGGGLVDPMLGAIYPTPPENEWPIGNIELETNTEIIVKAVFMEETRTHIFRIRKILDGAPAVIFKLVPSVVSVIRNAAGVANPNSLSCTVRKIDGTSVTENDTSKTIQYITSQNSTWTNYTAAVPIPNAQTGGLSFIEFRLLDGQTVIDKDRVPVVQEGQQGNNGQDAPKYLGKTVTITTTAVVAIQLTPAATTNFTAKTGDYISFAGTSASGTSPWKKNTCLHMEWHSMDSIRRK